MKITCPLVLTIAILVVPLASFSQAEDEILTLKNRIIDLQNKGQLGFKEFALCKNILGFGSYVPAEKPVVRRGKDLLIYYEPLNLYTDRTKGQYEVWYKQAIFLISEDRKVLSPKENMPDFHYMSKSPVLDIYAANTLNLGRLSSGKYIYKVVLRDKLKNVRAEHAFEFRIVK